MSVALVIGLIPLANVQTSTKAAEKFAITTPYYNALVAAGHFDIKRNGTTEKNVKNYSVYLDGEKIGTTQSTSMDCYTTKVAMHTAYVEAVYTDGTTAKTDEIKFGVPKKGLGLAADMGRNLDLKDQCNMSVDSVFNLWSSMMNDNINISSPVTAVWPKASENWFQPFMNKVNTRDYVERYAGFCFNNKNTGLWLYNTGELTLAGEMYRSNGNPAGYEPSTEPEENASFTFGTKNDVLDDAISINGVQCTNYVKQGGVTATASSENGDAKALNTIDNNKNTRWESKWNSDNENITCDLGSEKSIKKLQIL